MARPVTMPPHDAADREDRRRMLQVGRGDREAFAALWEGHHLRVFNFLLRLTGQTARAEDLLQETFLQLWHAAPGYKPIGRFTTYLYQIARHLFYQDRDKTIRRKEIQAPSTDEASTDVPDMAALTASAPPAETVLEEDEERKLIRESLESLPTEQREVFVLAQVVGLKYKEIAEILQIPLGTVKSRMMYAERHLRPLLEPLMIARTRTEGAG